MKRKLPPTFVSSHTNVQRSDTDTPKYMPEQHTAPYFRSSTILASMILLLILAFSLYSGRLYAQSPIQPLVGLGTAENPFEIATLENLYWIAEDSSRWDKHYIQTDTINAATTSGWFGGSGWTPIGDEDTPFTGTYNGNGHLIDSLFINNSGINGLDDQGLFGTVDNNGAIRNIGVVNARVSARYAVGIVAGRNKGIIENSFATGTVYGLTWVGGLVGMNNEGSVLESFANVAVSGYQNLGGLTGWNHYATIRNSYALGNVASDGGFAGGLVGRNTFASVYDSYSTGSVTGPQNIGGLVGFNNNIVSNSFWDVQTSGQATSQGGTGLTTVQMKKIGNYPQWSFPSVWRIDESAVGPANNGYPSLYWQGFAHNPTAIVVAVAATNVSPTGFTARWQSPDNTEGFFIDIATDENFTNFVAGFNNLEIGNVTSLLFENVAPNTFFYFYRVRAKNSAGSGATSNVIAVSTGFSGGAGTIANPYLISNLNDLKLLSETPPIWTSHFRQTTNLTFTAPDFEAGGNFFNLGAGFIPIGSETRPFVGTYDGGGHLISGLYINRILADYQGLFGIIGAGGVVRNVGVTNGAVTGKQFVGALAGRNSGTISASFATGTVAATNVTGGLAGWNDGGATLNSYAAVAVSGDSIVGGLIGLNHNSTVTNSYSTGSVTGILFAGGLIGVNNDRVENSYWDTQTSGLSASAAGIGISTERLKKRGTFAGWSFPLIWRIDESSINADNNEYPSLSWQGLSHNPTPQVIATRGTNTTPTEFTANWLAAQGVTGYRIDVSDNILFDTFVSGYHDIDVGNVTSFQITGLSPQTGFHYFRVRGVNNTGTGANSNVIIVGIVFSGGDGSQTNPYLISDVEDLKFLSENPYYWDSHFAQTNDIEFTPSDFLQGGLFYNDSTGFIPIGNITSSFTGSYDGKGFTITGLMINRPTSDYQALFGYVGSGATIKNIQLESVSITGRHYIAGLVAKNRGIIEKSSARGLVSGVFAIGGLVGMNHLGQVVQSFADVDVTGVEKIGGLTGWNHYGSITESYARGAVLGIGNKIGGLVGRNSFSTITNSYSTGNTFGSTPTGGLIGLNESSVVQNSYWDTQESSRSTSDGGSGKTTTEMKNIATFRDGGWLFTGVWHIDMKPNSPANDGYPSLAWEGLAHGENLLVTTSSPLALDFKALLGGNITNNGLEEITEMGILYSQTNPLPLPNGQGVSKVIATLGTGSFVVEVSGLQPLTSYYFRAYAITAGETAFGSAISFTTRDTQTITFPLLENQRYGNANLALSATSTSGLPIVYQSSNHNVATIQGSQLTIRGAGTVVITAVQNGNQVFAPALPVQQTLVIAKAALRVRANHHTKIYGNADPAFTVTYQGFVGNDNASDLSGVLAFDRIAGENIGTYILTPRGLLSDDYEITFENGNLEITPKQLTIGGSFTVNNKIFDGTTTAVISQNNLILVGVVSGDVVNLSNVVAEFTQAGIGTTLTAQIVSATITGSHQGNYTLSLIGAPVAFANITTNIEITDSDKILVYPNPFVDYLYFKNLHQASTISITDLTGAKIAVFEPITNQINLEHLPNGVYIVSIITPNAKPYTIKVIKE